MSQFILRGWRKTLFLFFVIVFLGIAARFFMTAIERSAGRELSSDESSTLKMAISQGEVLDVLINGAKVQASSAPLDYVPCIILYKIREQVHYFGLPENTYFRLNAILSSLISGLIIAFLLWRQMAREAGDLKVLSIQGVLLAVSLGFFYFWPFNFAFSLEMRPYSLWNALFFLAVMLLVHYRTYNWPVQIVLMLLAATATAAVLQFFALASAFAIIRSWEGDQWRGILNKAVRIFAAPMLIAIYYIVHPTVQYAHGEADRYWGEFWHFWLTKEKIPLLSVLGILMTYREKSFWSFTMVFISFLILYGMSPAINYICVSKHYFFSSRQYIYYDLIYPVFLLTLAVMLPSCWGRWMSRLVAGVKNS